MPQVFKKYLLSLCFKIDIKLGLKIITCFAMATIFFMSTFEAIIKYQSEPTSTAVTKMIGD